MRIGLVKKMLLWYAAIILPAFLLLQFVVSGVIGSNNEKSIRQNLLEYRNSCETYVARALLSQSRPANEENFRIFARQSAGDLRTIFGRDLEMYSPGGELVYSSVHGNVDASAQDLQYALEGKNAFSIVNGEKKMVYLSFPIEISEKTIGIMRIVGDYTPLFENGEYISRIVAGSSAGIFLVVLILFLVINANIIAPIRGLRRSIVTMQENPERLSLLPVTRKDEIGELTESYNAMAATIRDQFAIIQREKANLRRMLEYRKDFYDRVTHELKTPLTIILGYAEMMEQTGMEDAEFNARGLKEIIGETRRLKDMVETLLEISRETGKPEQPLAPVDVSGLLMRIAQSMKIRARRYGAEILLDLPREAMVMGEEEKLRQLFVNLLDNAMKYGVPHEPIHVRVRLEKKAVVVRICNAVDDSVNMAEIQKFFLPFYRQKEARRERGSVGLGLTICRNIMDLHQGEMEAFLEEGRLCFQMTFLNHSSEEGQ